MSHQELILKRLDEIGASLERSGNALALIGLGSVGIELERLDEYSDLDFFAVVKPGCKAAYINDLSWLSEIAPIAYSFMNTADGYKLLFADDVYCEFAILEPSELAGIPFAEGRIVWRAPAVSDDIRIPARKPAQHTPPTREWLLGEALTCLYVGLGRLRRGEVLSAQRFIQHYAVDRLLELADQVESETPGFRDEFSSERRFEQRFPEIARLLPQFVQGYSASRESALAILDFLDRHFEVNPVLKTKIRTLAAPAGERLVYFITHPDVVIDPQVPVPQWPLSPRGLERMQKLLEQPWIDQIGAIYSSDELKAMDAGRVIAAHLGVAPRTLPGLGEVDRSSTGYLPPAEHSQAAHELFAHPELSFRGWETARCAQERIVAAVEDILNSDPGSGAVGIVSHGGVGTLYLCHVKGFPIDKKQGQPGTTGGYYFCFTARSKTLIHDWRSIDG